jgi:hypothetical protein
MSIAGLIVQPIELNKYIGEKNYPITKSIP